MHVHHNIVSCRSVLFTQDTPRPQITMPNQIKRQTSIESEDINANHEKTAKPSPAKPKPAQKNEKPAARTGWFGGIFSGFGLRPKNQMKLPDDKNPSVSYCLTTKS